MFVISIVINGSNVMAKSWLEIEESESLEYLKDVWISHQSNIQNNNFWADEIKKYKDDPEARLKIAMDNLPLPGAFKQAMISLRAMIRIKKKNKEDFLPDLKQLYFLASVFSFYIPRCEELNLPGYNIFERVPGSMFKNLDIKYSDIGYEHLELLNKTDIKWITEEWGEVENHTTLNIKYNHIWNEYIEKFRTHNNAEKNLDTDNVFEYIYSESEKIDKSTSNKYVILSLVISSIIIIYLLFYKF